MKKTTLLSLKFTKSVCCGAKCPYFGFCSRSALASISVINASVLPSQNKNIYVYFKWTTVTVHSQNTLVCPQIGKHCGHANFCGCCLEQSYRQEGVFGDNKGYFLLFLHKIICCDPPPSEPSRRDGSAEGSQHMVSVKKREKSSPNYLKYSLLSRALLEYMTLLVRLENKERPELTSTDVVNLHVKYIHVIFF